MAPSAPRGVIAAIATAIDPHGEKLWGRRRGRGTIVA